VTTLSIPPTVSYNSQGLLTAVVQDAHTHAVLMVGYMNADALSRTVQSGEAWFWSRSRQALWHKGATSGNYLRVVELRADCDGDALLVLAHPQGPTCHTGARSCFDPVDGPLDASSERPAAEASDKEATPAVLASLFEVIEGRRRQRPEGAYTTYLFDKGVDKICKKIGEEATEVVIAAKNASAAELTSEMADLFYHALVLLAATETPPGGVWEELRRRQGQLPRPR